MAKAYKEELKMKLPILKKLRYLTFAVLPLALPLNTHAACNAAAPATTPDDAFTLNGNGTVTHLDTGLTWKLCAEGQTWNAEDGSCVGGGLTYTWSEALQVPSTLNVSGGYAGYNDWRLPNIKELRSLVETQCHSPAINDTVFNHSPALTFVTSTPSVVDGYVTVVNFLNGEDETGRRYLPFYLRLVRGGN